MENLNNDKKDKIIGYSTYNFNKKLTKIEKKVLNRRKKKLDELLSDRHGYFSEDSIKQRDPILYEIYVGSHKRNNELFKKSLQKIEPVQMSEILLNRVEDEVYQENLEIILRKECNKYGEKLINELYKGLENLSKFSENILEDEIDELIRLMIIRFLTGEDKEYFNYDEVDYNEIYDDLEIINQDLEDNYFDKQEENEINECNYTGIVDY